MRNDARTGDPPLRGFLGGSLPKFITGGPAIRRTRDDLDRLADRLDAQLLEPRQGNPPQNVV
jgi:hypothetical protein